MFKYTYILFWFIYFTPSIPYAQTNNINFTSLSSKDGLLSNSVNAIVKDRYGLMWFATDDGLNKFDGTNFTVYRYRPGDTASLRANEVLALHEDRSGNLWIGTSGGGLSLYNRKKDAFSHLPNKGPVKLIRNDVIRSICSDYQGKILLAQYESLFQLDPVTLTLSKHPLLDSDGKPVRTTLVCVYEDSKHRLWTGTDSGLFLYKRGAGTFKRYTYNKEDPFSLADNLVKAITEDKWGNLWIGTANGLSKLQPDGTGFITYRHTGGDKNTLINNEINCIATDDQGILWIGTSEGLNAFNLQTNHFSTYTAGDGNMYSLSSNWIKCAYFDKQGIYWFGTLRGGIDKYDKNINLFSLTSGSTFLEKKANTTISALAENRNGKVWVGTDGGGLYEFDRVKRQTNPVPIRLNNQLLNPLSILALHQGQTNKLYIGTYAQGLIIIDQKTGKVEQFKKGTGFNNLTSNDIFCIYEDKKGNIWLGSNGGGVNVLNKEKVIAKFSRDTVGAGETFLPANGYIRAIQEDEDGNVWIGTHGGGIAIYNPVNGQWTKYNEENSLLPSNKVHALHADRSGKMWIGTFGGGLAWFDKNKKQFITLTEKDGLPNTTIYQIVEDLQGMLWLSTNVGISGYDVNSRKFRNFSSHNGVQNANFVHGSGIRLTDGELFFGGLLGFNYFYPNRLTVNNNVPNVILTDLKISNKSVPAGNDAPIKEHISVANEIRLDYKQNFAVSFVALNYTVPKQNHYAYKLDGFDKDWNYTGALNTASYTNLDPGEYVFRVKASNNDDVWSSKDTSIRIYVKPPFWRTGYAYVLYVLAIGSMLFFSRHRGISRIRKKFALEQERQEIKRTQELDRLKLKFLTNLSHDFRTPISLIMGPVTQLIEAEGAPAKLHKLQMIRRNARRLLNLVNQLLDFRKMEEHELRLQLSGGEFISFIKEVTDSFRDISERKHIHFAFTSSIERLNVLFDHDKLERVLFNLLSNAFKFTLEGGHVAVELHSAEIPHDQENTWVVIKVIDSGIGIPEEKRDMIFDRFFQHTAAPSILNQGSGIGLSITKEFIKMHGGTISVTSETGKGSEFTIQIPLKPALEPAVAIHPAMQTEITPIDETQRNDAELRPTVKQTGSLTESLSILLVEDNEDFRFYLKDNLKNTYKILEAANGNEGWQQALAHHPQLIVSDISMPEMDGIALVKKLKADKRTGHIPVILLTAVSGQEQQLKGLETGANDYITKPFNFELLNVKIKNLLDLKNTMKSTYVKQIKMSAPEVAITSSDEKLLHAITSYLEENLTNTQVSVETLSKHVGMSRGSLYTKLLQLTGQTPVEYIRSFRLDKAIALMEKSDMTIAEIAYQAGFTTPNYFARSFRSRYNMAPSAYIFKIRKQKS